MMRSILLLAVVAAGCETSDGGTYARRITSPTELIGGPGAIGDVGDWLIGNQRIKVILQDQGWSRGFGMFGGGIIDADLVRAGTHGSLDNGNGKDNFGEFFPALLLQAFDVGEQWVIDSDGERVQVPGIEIIADGSDGGAAIIRTRASGGDFITMVEELLGAAVPEAGLRFETDYVIAPGARHVEIVGRLINISGRTIVLPDEGISALLEQFDIEGLQTPLGDVALFGGGNRVFAPGAVERWENGRPVPGAAPRPAGFDLRFSVEANYPIPRVLPALPGLVADFVATAGDDVSYGFAAGDSDRNYVWLNRDQYGKDPHAKISKHGMLVPFLIDAFTGAYYEVPPTELARAGVEGDIFEYRRYVIIGDGDVASIRDELYKIRGQGTATLGGRIVNANTGRPEADAWLHILDHEGFPYSQVSMNEDGRFVCAIEPGDYYYIVTAPGRYPYPGRGKSEATHFATFRCPDDEEATYSACQERAELRDRELFIQIPDAAELHVDIRDDAGRPLPAKVTVVSTFESEFDNQDPMNFLFDFWLGEQRRATDLTWRDPPEQRERRFVEEVFLTHDGFVKAKVRPSCNGDRCRRYDIYVSRGLEYDTHVTGGLLLEPGRRTSVDATLTRVVDTTDWISADLHVHSVNSVDSFYALDDRIKQAAAEGLEIPVASDHNWVSDWRPTIAGLGLGDWLNTVTSVELSTLEVGHFNIYPLRYDIGSATHFPFVEECNPGRGEKVNRTAFDWVECTPQQLFDNARALGRYGPAETIVQINHPRDTILGYFNQYYLNPWSGSPDCRGITGDEDDPACAYCGEECGKLFSRNYPEAAFFLYPHDRVPGQYGREAFSFDFDAIEVFNGKRLDLLHGFRVAEDISAEELATITDVCNSGHPDNAPGELRLRNGGHIAYPGGVDDWLHMLNDGRAYTAVGNSDSHKLAAEVGFPRTYLYIEPFADGERRDLIPAGVTDLDIVHAIRSRRVMATNGPFLDMFVVTDDAEDPDAKISWPMGSVVRYGGDNTGRAVEFIFILRSAPWVSVDEIVIWANAEIVGRIGVPQGTRDDGRAIDDENTFRWTGAFDADSVIVAEARGSRSMFPIVTPKEQPPSNITDALGGIVSGLGLEGTFGRGDNITAPDFVQKATPYVLTNPIWLDIDGSGTWTPPGNASGPGPARDPLPDECPETSEMRSRTGAVERGVFGLTSTGHHARGDIRKLFSAYATK